MGLWRKITTRRMASIIFYLNLLDFATDYCYLWSKPFLNNIIHNIAIASAFAATGGIFIFMIFGFIFDTTLKVRIFRSQVYVQEQVIKDFKETMTLCIHFIFKTALEIPISKNKALYRVSMLLHVTLESFPELVIQCINNSRMNLWNEPLSIISVTVSSLMIILALLVTIKTDKHFL
ncbi:unnamed protein product [Blepharisma stoltei]|uniref:Gustatory receptor n=1 Tax=Blepharisma stoltei TaxID=1481888 RepID=A0AAU9K9C3_9CILI|nr:unnamed protein product [Blepharisma stoltei]